LNRYKTPSGWRGESYRHSLASRGVKTRSNKIHYLGVDYAKFSWKDVSGKKIKWSIMKEHLGFLVHSTTKKHLKDIKQKGLRLSENPWILKGIYTFPVASFCDVISSVGSYHLLIDIDGNANYYDAGVQYPMEAHFGSGSKSYQNFYKDSVADLGYRDIYNYPVGSDKFNEIALKVFDDKTLRQKFNEKLYHRLRNNDIDIFQRGGEIIILNDKVIKKTRWMDKEDLKICQQIKKIK
jgi:hypothetical protein